MHKRVFVIILFCLVSVLAGLPTASEAQGGGNLLENPGFEGQYATWWDNNIPYNTAQMAPGWNPWWKSQDPDDLGWKNRMPEYKPAAPYDYRIRSGSNAQQYFTFYGTHDAGVYQQANVGAGNKVRFSIWIQVWSSEKDDPLISQNNGRVQVQVGIDPYGGTDGLSSNIVWSAAQQKYDEWFQMSIQTDALANAVTVFVRSTPDFPIKHNDIYLDDAVLEVVGEGNVTIQPTIPFDTPTMEATFTLPPAGPTNTPRPTSTPFPTSIAPTMKPPSGLYDCTVEYRVVAGDTLYVIAGRYDSTLDAIVKANGIANAGLIVVGQTLVIPVKCAGTQPTSPPPTATSPGAPPQPTAVPCGPTQHIVQPGENLFRIALRYNLTYLTLARLNGIVNPNLIRVGRL